MWKGKFYVLFLCHFILNTFALKGYMFLNFLDRVLKHVLFSYMNALKHFKIKIYDVLS